MRKIFKISIISIFLLALTTNLIACDCKGLSIITKEDYDQAGEIFIGRVIKIEEYKDEWKKAVTFEVIEPLKPLEEIKQITVWTAFDAAACGLSVHEGEKWYIFADKNNKNELSADLCGRSVHLNKKFNIRLRYFSEKRIWKREIHRFKKEKKFIQQINASLTR